jgi:PAS domain S-box-containing protein
MKTKRRAANRGGRRKAVSKRPPSTREQVMEAARQHAVYLSDIVAAQSRRQGGAAGIVSDGHITPLLILSRHGIAQSANEAALRFLGCKPEEILFRPFSDWLWPEDSLRFYKFLRRAVAHGWLRGDFLLRAGQDKVPFQIVIEEIIPSQPNQLTHPQPCFRAALIDLRLDDADLPWVNESRRDFRELLSGLEVVIWRADYPMRFTFVSDQARRMLGYDPAEWTRDAGFWEKNIFWDDRECIARARELAIRKRKAHVLEYRMLTSSRQVIWVRDSATVTREADGEIKLAGILTDITEAKLAHDTLLKGKAQLEQAVEQRTARLQASVRSMELFCYGIAHDLRAPLRHLSAYSELIAEQYGDRLDETGRDFISRIVRASRHFGSLIEALLRYGRVTPDTVAIADVDLQKACTQAVDCLQDEAQAGGAEIHVQCSPLAVRADPTLLQEILINLIGNALKFARPGVKPVISIEARTIDAVDPQNPAIRLSVTDNGLGIGQENRGKIFDVFQRLGARSDIPGTGIGLALVKRAVEVMDGRVGFHSQPNDGSTFWFELPPAPPISQAVGRTVPVNRASERRVRPVHRPR